MAETAQMGRLEVMGPSGDMKTIWDPSDAEETAAAKKTFDDLKKKGYRAWKVDDDGEKTTQMKKFSPKAGRVIMAAPVVGG